MLDKENFFFLLKKTIGQKHNKEKLHDKKKKERKNQNRIVLEK
jgi:hypothetical protein